MPNAYKRQLVDENGDYIYPVVNEGDDKVPVDSTDITGYSGTILDLVKGIYPEGYHRWYTTTDGGASNITDRPTGTSGQGFVLEAFKCRDYNGSNNSKYRLVCRKSGDTSEWVAVMFTSDTSITWVQNIAATGGTLTGRLKWKDSNALQAFSGNPPFLIGMESFANGGETKYVSLDNARNAILSDGSVTEARLARAVKSPVLLYESTGSGTGTTAGWQPKVPVSTYVWDSSTSKSKYSKVVLEIVAEPADGTEASSRNIRALNASSSTLNTFQVGHECWGTTFNNIRRDSSEIVSAKIAASNSVYWKVELYCHVGANYVPFDAIAFGGTSSDVGMQRFTGRIKTAISNVGYLQLSNSFTVKNYYKVRLWGYV